MKKTIIYVLSVIVLSGLFGWTQSAMASIVGLHGPSQPVSVGETFQLFVRVNTENELINALTVEVSFPGDLVSFVDFSDGDSIVNFWLEKPSAGKSGPLTLSGVIPGGISVRDGLVATLRFKAVKESQADIVAQNTKLYLHDGKGTEQPASPNTFGLSIARISESNLKTADSGRALVLDFFAPEPFDVHLVKDPDIFEGNWAVTFATQDKGSGIKEFYIRERILGFFGSWRPATNPYRLHHQSLLGVIEVQAVDGVGRTASARFVPERFYVFWTVVAVGILTTGIWIGRRFFTRIKH